MICFSTAEAVRLQGMFPKECAEQKRLGNNSNVTEFYLRPNVIVIASKIILVVTKEVDGVRIW